jgi:hypothetical protein
MAKIQTISWNGDIITIAYGNGQTFTGDCSTLPRNIYQACDAARHGISQKLGDAKSGGTASEKFEEVQAIWAGLKAGNWNRRGTGDESLIQDVYRILAQAAGLKGKAAEEKVSSWFAQWQTMSEADRDKVRAKDFFKSALAKAKADRKVIRPEANGDFDPNA